LQHENQIKISELTEQSRKLRKKYTISWDIIPLLDVLGRRKKTKIAETHF